MLNRSRNAFNLILYCSEIVQKKIIKTIYHENNLHRIRGIGTGPDVV
jgi:hypothetical protein